MQLRFWGVPRGGATHALYNISTLLTCVIHSSVTVFSFHTQYNSFRLIKDLIYSKVCFLYFEIWQPWLQSGNIQLIIKYDILELISTRNVIRNVYRNCKESPRFKNYKKFVSKDKYFKYDSETQSNQIFEIQPELLLSRNISSTFGKVFQTIK